MVEELFQKKLGSGEGKLLSGGERLVYLCLYFHSSKCLKGSSRIWINIAQEKI